LVERGGAAAGAAEAAGAGAGTLAAARHGRFERIELHLFDRAGRAVSAR